MARPLPFALAGAGVVAAVALAAVFAQRARSAAEDAASDGGAVALEADQAEILADASEARDADPPAGPSTFNVILVTIDTLRWDLGFSGYPRPVTPNLDKLAARSVVFDRAYATASYTPKCVGPLLIGRYASETFRDGEHYTTFHGKNVFLAERIRDAGHRTLGAMCHHYFKWKTGLDQGFDVWDTSAVPDAPVDNDPTITSETLTGVALDLLRLPENATPGPDEDAGADAAAPSPRRFFAWFHYMDPHLPYMRHEEAPDLVASAPDAAPAGRAIYDQEVWFTDKHVGRLIDFVAEQPWGAETAIIVTADHGEAFGERGFYRHGREVWESVVRVPLIVYVPSAKPRHVEAKRSHIDLAPTVLELLGVSPEDGPALRGKSLLADVKAPPDAEPEDRDVYIDMPEGPFNEPRRALITGGTPGTKLIDFGDDRYALYDLASDPLETHDLRGDPERRKELIAQMKAFRAALEEVPAPPSRHAGEKKDK